jgi:hypothetical protein
VLTQELEELELSLKPRVEEDLDKYTFRTGTTWREQSEANIDCLFRAMAEIQEVPSTTKQLALLLLQQRDYYKAYQLLLGTIVAGSNGIGGDSTVAERCPSYNHPISHQLKSPISRISDRELDIAIDSWPSPMAPRRNGLPLGSVDTLPPLPGLATFYLTCSMTSL